MTTTLYHADCLVKLQELPDNTVATIVCDPPYGLEFMGKDWDKFGAVTEEADEGTDASHPFRDGSKRVRYGNGMVEYQKWCEHWARAALRVIKPGGFMLAFGGTRTWHRLASGIEDAGWELRDTLMWLHGQGFPKGCNLEGGFAGYGTAMKPSWEPIIMAMKPCVGSFAANAVSYGVAGLNIDGCRIAGVNPSVQRRDGKAPGESVGATGWVTPARPPAYNTQRPGEQLGRWPANLIFQHSPECVCVGTRLVQTSMGVRGSDKGNTMYGSGNGMARPTTGQEVGYGDANGQEAVERWACVPECPVRKLDEQSGQRTSGYSAGFVGDIEASAALGDKRAMIRPETIYADTGGASRFFYCAKASRAEREAGVAQKPDGKPGNVHPTVKPLDLMRWLVRLTKTPTGGVVLDPFLGSGSTLLACVLEGRDGIGIEQDAAYLEIARGRIAHAEHLVKSTQTRAGQNDLWTAMTDGL